LASTVLFALVTLPGALALLTANHRRPNVASPPSTHTEPISS
jgi:hypothetical protein